MTRADHAELLAYTLRLLALTRRLRRIADMDLECPLNLGVALKVLKNHIESLARRVQGRAATRWGREDTPAERAPDRTPVYPRVQLTWGCLSNHHHLTLDDAQDCVDATELARVADVFALPATDMERLQARMKQQDDEFGLSEKEPG